MNTVLIIGAGGVSSVVVNKCAQFPEVFNHIVLASRTFEKCEKIVQNLKTPTSIQIDQVDADNTDEVVALIKKYKPNLVVNVALPYQDLSIMEACIETGVNYFDTANYEAKDKPGFCYKEQWALHDRFKDRGIMALLGGGFDPGNVNVYWAYALKHHFDEIHNIDIMDCNAGDHGHPFATNFNPEINIREITQPGKYYLNGEWIETNPLSVNTTFDFPQIGPRQMYLMYHEELESLSRYIPNVKRLRFWMTFGQEYLTHLRVLQNVGMTRIDPVKHQGVDIIPLQFLKALLPDPASLAANYEGKTNIGCMIEGVKDGQKVEYYIYNVCDHAECAREIGSQAISYTTGVPAALMTKLMLEGVWKGVGVFNVEQFDPDPFMNQIGDMGLPWVEEWL
jgi:saccharopine dehydrogenase (NAD+, L-lysine forming)